MAIVKEHPDTLQIAEELFGEIRGGIIGAGHPIRTPYGTKRLLYADWCASGRLYAPIETYMSETIGPYVGNTHTDSNATGASMTKAYHAALRVIKRHVNAGSGDVVLSTGTGMTGAINKLQRLLGLRAPETLQKRLWLLDHERPVVFITHMEHHSNHISWLETIGDVVIVPPDDQGLVSPRMLEEILHLYRGRPYKIGAFTACSNVTGLETPVTELARVMHSHGGLVVVDYSASAPYVPINMHPGDALGSLDAALFSPHKFLGGPGSNGILVFNSRLLRSFVPDEPGGGTVDWTDPWGRRRYVANPEEREDGGTPGFLQAIRTALCMKLKERMGTARMKEREKGLLAELWSHLDSEPRIHVLEGRHRNRIGIVSLVIEGLHYKLVTRLLNDRFGIQARGGCSCAGSYGHFLFGISQEASDTIYGQVAAGEISMKPGWVRISLHPVMTRNETGFIGRALLDIARHGDDWARDYVWDFAKGDFRHVLGEPVSPIQELGRSLGLFE